MKIVVDLQGAQSTGSRTRGIGRYSLALAKAMAATCGNHEIWIALSGLFPDSIESLRADFEGLISPDHVVVWDAPGPVAMVNPSNRWRMETGELVREAFVAKLKPDVLHLSSLFEGLGDDALTSVRPCADSFPTAMTLYDLIPLVNRRLYLSDPVVESWYEYKLGSLRRCQLWLAISEWSRREAIDLLGLPDEWVVNISTAAHAKFRQLEVSVAQQFELRQRYGLRKPYVMYTGGIDRRKNIEGLIAAFCKLPEAVRSELQLAIVCSATTDQMSELKRVARKNGLAHDEIILTGFVPDDDLVMLYNLCKVFTFPSWHEGFGLPALEAMSCGAAVIGACTSSVPEVIGRDDALFDPRNETAIAAKLHEVLTDEAFRLELKRYALPQASKFSWTRIARSALDAMERVHRQSEAARVVQIQVPQRRPRLAYISPLPPERSGIAGYSAELLPELARHYDIDVVVDQPVVDDAWIRANTNVRTAQWFDENAESFDRVLYHIGNSTFHAHMFGLLERHSGTVVLHDFFLSGVLAHMEWTGYSSLAWTNALYASHGYHAVKDRTAVQNPSEESWKALVGRYPANLSVLDRANGIIVHSEFARRLAVQWYGKGHAADWWRVPMARKLISAPNRADARAELGLTEADFLVCCFGMMGPTKLNHRLLAAWLKSQMVQDPHNRLAFVGEKEEGEYGAAILRAIRESHASSSIHLTGFASSALYQTYLAAADVAVQLRAMSRGETSAAIVDCMVRGIPTIVNAVGSAAELPPDCVLSLPAEFSDSDLQAALVQLRGDLPAAAALGARAAKHAREQHDPRIVADRYHEAIEIFEREGPRSRGARLVRQVAAVGALKPSSNKDWLKLAECVAQNTVSERAGRLQWLVDVSKLMPDPTAQDRACVLSEFTMAWLNHPPDSFRVEPVFYDAEGIYRYARDFTATLLRMDRPIPPDEPVEVGPGDVFVTLGTDLPATPQWCETHKALRRHGVSLYCYIPRAFFSHGNHGAGSGSRDGPTGPTVLQAVFELADGLICSSVDADELAARVVDMAPARACALKIGCAPSTANAAGTVDAKRFADAILLDRWHAVWRPESGLATCHEDAPSDRRADTSAITTSFLSEPWSARHLRRIGSDGRAPQDRKPSLDLDSFLTVVYGENARLSGEVKLSVQQALGKNIVENTSDMRRITMALDRQTFPTPISVRFATRDLQSSLINGIPCPVDRDDISVSSPSAATGSWEPHLVACFRRICSAGSVVFDVGANVGYHTLLLAQLVGRTGVCYAFEPNSENCRLILLGAERNEFENIRLMPIALSNESGWTYFSSHIGSNGGFTTRDTAAADGDAIVVPVFTLDELQVPDVDIIKVDVEGAEYKVLKGGEERVRRCRPAIVSELSLEMTSRVSGVSAAEYLAWIVNMDYEIYVLNRHSEPLVAIASVEMLLNTWGDLGRIEDLLFLPREKAYLVAGG